jgi:hypothetical protein
MAEDRDDRWYENAIAGLLRNLNPSEEELAELDHLSLKERYEALHLIEQGVSILKESKQSTKH